MLQNQRFMHHLFIHLTTFATHRCYIPTLNKCNVYHLFVSSLDKSEICSSLAHDKFKNHPKRRQNEPCNEPILARPRQKDDCHGH